jgi:E3 ubiquitin-protein ligase CHFR
LQEEAHNKLTLDLDKMAEQFDCGICYQLMHQAVSLMPCLHTYCGGCFSDWLKRGSKDCPNCRDAIIMVKKNATLNSTIDSYLLVKP